MNSKLFEVRDDGTYIPVLAVLMIKSDGVNEAERYLLGRSGFGNIPLVLVVNLNTFQGQYDPYNWKGGGRTMPHAHEFITHNFDSMEPGQVVCVETILGERDTPKVSDRLAGPFSMTESK